MDPLQIFISYAKEDKEFLDSLVKHLSPLSNKGIIKVWDDEKIEAGEKWKDKINQQIKDSDVIIFLVSAFSLASDFIYNVELKLALERHKNESLIVIPVIVRPADWMESDFVQFQALPPGGKPVEEWENSHKAWLEVVIGIKKAVEELLETLRKIKEMKKIIKEFSEAIKKIEDLINN